MNVKKILLFLVLTFSVNWLLAGIYFARGGTLTSPFVLPVFVFYMFIPMAMALLVQRVIYHEPVVGPLGISFQLNRWFVVAWLLPSILGLAAFGVALLLPGISYSPGMENLFAKSQQALSPEQVAELRRQVTSIPPVLILLISILGGLIAGATINAIAGFGEELGWRGLLQRELAPLGFWKSSLLIGIIWGIWHAPLIWHGYNYPQHPQLGVVMMTAFTVLFTPVIAYVRLRARSVIAAAVLHGTLNGTAGVAVLFLAGGNDLTTGLLGLPGFIVLIVLNVLIFVHERFVAKEPVMSNLP